MKLRNKKTGEYGNYKILSAGNLIRVIDSTSHDSWQYDSLEGLYEEWEDVKNDPYIVDMIEDNCISSVAFGADLQEIERAKECGLYFETKEEAQRTVERLKAWKRLMDKGFRFILDEETEMPMFIYSGANGEKCITNAEESKQCRSDIKLLFGGEE